MKNLILAAVTALLLSVNAGAQQPAGLSTAPVALSAAACECSGCIAVYGDSRSNHDIHAKIAALMQARRPLTVLHTGDMVSSGRSKKDWEKFKEITKGLREGASFYAVMGNHEKGGEKTFGELFRFPGNGRWYRADVHGVRFFMLDFLSPLEKGSEQYKWLEAGLASPAGADKFTVIVVHKPLMSSGAHRNEKWRAAADFEALIRKYRVALVLAGHEHNYERLEKDGIVYIVTGGGGAPLYPLGSKNQYSRAFSEASHYCLLSLCGGVLKGEVFDISDTLIDSFEIAAGKAGTEEGVKK
ncbi:MAG: metallophosphoesterase [Elusimicrobiota bacterium]|nr:metallophosphoesterase [Elusimicrobiota bacterium]